MPTENSFEFFREEVARLTASFHKDLADYRSEGYDESALRNDFLTPFWRALGWDVENKQGLAQSLREVQSGVGTIANHSRGSGRHHSRRIRA